jgi:uncharacterized protein (TIGR03435 family)
MLRVAVALLAASAFAQTPEFEVATFKLSPPPVGDSFTINLGKIQNRTLTLSNANLADYLKFAFGIASDAQLSGPDWMHDKTIRFDTVAQIRKGASREEALLMLRTLLAERLKLRWHFEKREIAHLALVPGRNGAHLKPPNGDGVVTAPFQRAGRIVHNDMPLDTLTRLLSRFEGQPVTDETGLTGTFTIQLEWAPEGKADSPDPPAGPSLFTAVQQQLGLRLIPRKSAIDVLIVDAVERTPSAN